MTNKQVKGFRKENRYNVHVLFFTIRGYNQNLLLINR